MSAVSHATPTIQGGLLIRSRTPIEDVRSGDLWHPDRDMFPTRIVAVRNVRGGCRVTDEHGCARTYRHGSEVRTATLVGGEWPTDARGA